ncbi:hypothetical protein TPDSL_16080 [Terrisporobacter petrolearius]|uniref:YcxB family protein n=1 Tax=Terrisporobacter petrolearius TaxID=1460447 RepID=UPI003365E504
MNTLFENEYVLTKELVLEFSKTFVSKKYKIFCYVFATLSIIFAIWSLTVSLNIIFRIIFFGFPFYFIGVALKLHKFMGKKLYEQQRAINNYETLRKIINFYDDKLEVISPNGGKTIIFYHNIKKIYKTKKFLVLNSENKLAVPIKKDSFIKGTCEDFEMFIFSKSHI